MCEKLGIPVDFLTFLLEQADSDDVWLRHLEQSLFKLMLRGVPDVVKVYIQEKKYTDWTPEDGEPLASSLSLSPPLPLLLSLPLSLSPPLSLSIYLSLSLSPSLSEACPNIS